MADKRIGVTLDINTKVSGNGLQTLQSTLEAVANKANSELNPGKKIDQGLKEASITATKLSQILSKSFNSDLGVINVTKFNQELKNSGLTLQTVQTNLSKAGAIGVTAYNKTAQAILNTNMQLKQSNTLLDSMATTMMNTVKWGITSSIFNTITNSITKAYGYVKQLDSSLNDIRIVTGKSAEEMDKFAEKANDAAKALGASTLDYSKASLIYYQQGLSDQEAQARAETTVKVANVTGQTGNAVSEQLTAVWNGYKVSAQETEVYVDKLAAVAATTAADLEELSIGMSKVASAANAMGVDFDDLNAQIATIVSVTRQAPESVGTALKTIYARLGDLKVDGVDEFGVKLGEVSSQLQTMGIEILYQNGNMRDMSSVMTEVAEKWNTWTRAQQQAAAVAMAGKRQYNNLVALFENWDMYSEALETSKDSLGTLQKQQDTYMESTSAKLKTLQATWQELYKNLLKSDEINKLIEALTKLISLSDKFIKSFGGGFKSIASIGAIISNIFSKQISNGIIQANQRLNGFKNNLKSAQAIKETLDTRVAQLGPDATSQDKAAQKGAELNFQMAQKTYEVRHALTNEQYNELVNYQREAAQIEENLAIQEAILDRQVKRTSITAEHQNMLKEGYEADIIYGAQIDELQEKVNISLGTQYTLEQGIVELNGEETTLRERATAAGEQANIVYKEQNAIIQKTVNELLTNEEISKNLTEEERKRLEGYQNQEFQVRKIYGVTNDLDGILKKLNREESQRAIFLQESLDLLLQEEREARRLEGRYQKRNQLAEEARRIQSQYNQTYNDANNNKNIVQSVTAVTSTLGSMAMTWGSISSLIDTITDKNISGIDKLQRSLTTLTFSLPMLINSFVKLKDLFNVNIFESPIKHFNNLTKTRIADSKAADLQQKAEILRRKATEASYNVDKEVLISLEVKKASQEETIVITEEEEAAIHQNTIAKELETEATLAEAEAEKAAAEAAKVHKTAAASNPYGWILVALAAIVAATVAVIKINEKLEEQREEQRRLSIKENEEKLELIKANQELYSSFEKLYQEYQKTGIVSEELKNKTFELIDVYDIENGKVLALSERYKELAESIREARSIELGEQFDINNQTAELLMQSITNKNKSNFGDAIRYTFLGGEWATQKNNQYTFRLDAGLRDTATAYYANDILKDSNFLKDYQLKTNKLSGTAGSQYLEKSISLNNPDELLKTYNNLRQERNRISSVYEKDIEENNNVGRAANAILDSINEELNKYTEEDITKLQELRKNANTASLQGSFLSQYNSLSNIDLASISNIVSNLTNQYKGLLSNQDINKILSDEMSNAGLDENFQVKVEFLLKAADGKELTEEVYNTVDNLNAAQIAWLQLHLDTKGLDEELEDWINSSEVKNILDYEKIFGDATAQKNILSQIDEKGFKEEEISALYASNNGFNGVSESQFNAMDTGDQLDTAVRSYIDNMNYIEEHRKELNKELEEDLKQAEKDLSQYVESNIDAENQILNVIDSSDKLNISQEDMIAILAKAVEGNEDLTDAEKEHYEIFKKQAEENEIDIDNLKNYSLNYTKLSNNIKIYTNDLQRLTEANIDYSFILQEIKEEEKAHNAILDNIQSAYNTLNSIVENYNETHAWTIDNVQQLITMDDQYVAALQFENGQLVLNEAAFQAMTLAKLDDLEASVDLEFQQKMLAIAEKDEALAAAAAGAASIAAGQNMLTLGNNALTAADGVKILKETLDQIGPGSEGYDDLAKQTEKAWEARKKAIEDARRNVRKGGSGFNAAMGVKSSGGSSKSKKEESKNFSDEFDRYWEYKKAIDLLDKSLSRLEKQQSKLHGKELIESLKKENELLEQQKANYDALFEAQKREAGELKGQLEYYGAAFKDNGELTNYADVTTQMLAQYTSAIQQYNAGALDEAGLKLYEAQYEDFKKALERYDTLYYSEMQDTMDKLDDARRKQLENNLKAWETEIQIKLDLTKAKRNWNDFVRDIEQDFRKIYSDLTIESLFDTKNFKEYNEDLNTTLQAIHDVENEIDKLSATGKSDMFQSMSEAQEKLKDLGDELIENGKNLYELYENIWDNYIDKLDQAADNLKDINEEFEHITTELEYEKKLIELIYGDKAYAKMDKFYTAQQKNINAQLNSLKAQRDFWEQQFNAAYEMNKVNHNVILNDMSTWTEDMRKAYDEMIDSQEKLNDMIIDGINNLTDKYLNKLAETFDKLEKATWGMNLDDLKDDWDRITDLADEYLDDAEGIPQIQMLINKVNQGIDDTKDLKLQQKLAEFRDNEVQALMDKKDLTEDDLKLMEARYNIMLKEAALEDAQNAKNSMKLTRNSSGSWTYQYVADDTDVAEKQNDLLQSYQDLYKMADDAYQHAMELAMSSYETMQEKIKEIAEDTTITEEEKMIKIQEIQDTYLPMIQAAAENSELYRQEAIAATGMIFTEVCEQNEDAYEHLTDEQKILVDATKENHLNDYEAIREAVVDNTYPAIQEAATTAFEQTNLNSSTVAADVIGQWAGDDGESVKNKLNEAIDDIEKNTQDFEDELDNMRDIADIDFSDVDTMIDTTTDKIEDMGNKTEDMVNRSTSQLELMRQYVNDIEVAFGNVIERVFEAISAMAEYTEATAAAVEEMNNLIITSKQYGGVGVTPGTGGGPGHSLKTGEDITDWSGWQDDPNGVPGLKYRIVNGNMEYGVALKEEGEVQPVDMNVLSSLYKQTTSHGSSSSISDSEAIIQMVMQKYKNMFGMTIPDEVLKKLITHASQFASGGYTGEWDTSGKIGILHQKELVLNQDDTENFLKATSLLNNISKINGNIEDSIMTSILNMMGILAPKVSGFNMDNKSSEVGGNVFNITAEFPNANDVSSIKEAILSLPNIASQYVHQRS